MPGKITDAQRGTLRIMEDLLLTPVVICDDERVADEGSSYTCTVCADGQILNAEETR